MPYILGIPFLLIKTIKSIKEEVESVYSYAPEKKNVVESVK